MQSIQSILAKNTKRKIPFWFYVIYLDYIVFSIEWVCRKYDLDVRKRKQFKF